MHCFHCDSPLAQDAVFCHQCGYRVGTDPTKVKPDFEVTLPFDYDTQQDLETVPAALPQSDAAVLRVAPVAKVTCEPPNVQDAQPSSFADEQPTAGLKRSLIAPFAVAMTLLVAAGLAWWGQGGEAAAPQSASAPVEPQQEGAPPRTEKLPAALGLSPGEALVVDWPSHAAPAQPSGDSVIGIAPMQSTSPNEQRTASAPQTSPAAQSGAAIAMVAPSAVRSQPVGSDTANSAEPVPAPRTQGESQAVASTAKVAAPVAAKRAPQPQLASSAKTCADAGLLMRPMCFIEGAQTFWKCVPDGKRWNNDIPGCRRGESAPAQ